MRITDKDWSILIGLLLGDGYIDQKGRIQVEHGHKQEEYCIFKAKLLHSVCGGKDIKVNKEERTYSITKNGKKYKEQTFVSYRFRKLSKSFIQIRNLLYPNNKKSITPNVLDKLDIISIVLWWLDDGCITEKYTYKNNQKIKCGYTLRLFTYLSFEENLLIQKYFKDKFDILWNVVKANNGKDDQFMLRCGTIEGRKFLNLFRDYVREKIPSMSYKVIDI